MVLSIESLMTRSPITVPPAMRVLDAAQLAAERGIRHLLVVERNDLVGVLCVCDLHAAPASAPVADCMARRVITASPKTSPQVAAATMRMRRIGSLPVRYQGSTVGILTRSDLVRGGVPVEKLGVEKCAACGYAHNLKPDRRAPELLFCLYCRERSVSGEDDEIGTVD